MELSELLGQVARQNGRRQAMDFTQPKEIQAQVLKDILKERQAVNSFNVGDLVEQIDHLRRYCYPRAGQIAIVSDIVSDPKPDSDSNTYDINDIVVLAMVDTNEWVQFCVESWRFKKAEIAE